MSDKPFRPYSVTLNAGEERAIPTETDYIGIISATDITNVAVSFDHSSDFVNLPYGTTVEKINRQAVVVKNTSGAPNTMLLALGFGRWVDNRDRTAAAAAVVNVNNLTGGAVGQHTMVQSLPAVIASDQTAIPMKLDDGAGASVTVGQKTKANSLPMVLPSDQPIGSAGQATMVNSVPAVLASDHSAIPVNGTDSHSAAATGKPVRVGGKVSTASDATLADGDAADLPMTSDGQVLVKTGGRPEEDWSFAVPAGGLVNTTAEQVVKVGVAARRHYVTGIQIDAAALGGATEVVLLDGAAGTVLFRLGLTTAGLVTPVSLRFETPLRLTAANDVRMKSTVAVTGGIYLNVQGYTAP